MSGTLSATVANLFGGASRRYSSLAANANGRTRRETVHGRDYLVAPMVLLKPQVLHGSQGPLLYEAGEIARSVDGWNGVPVVIDHPTRNGAHVSGRTPDVLRGSEVGRVYNAKLGRGGRLEAEAWIDLTVAGRVAPDVVRRLEAGRPVEVSTGLYTQNTPQSGTFNGRGYTHVATTFKADHLAILPTKVGACSVSDGCGLLANHRGADMNTLTHAVLNAMSPAKGLSKAKACKMLDDGEANGQPLTPKQKRLFGMICGGKRPARKVANEVVFTSSPATEAWEATAKGEATPPAEEAGQQLRQTPVANCSADAACAKCAAKAEPQVENAAEPAATPAVAPAAIANAKECPHCKAEVPEGAAVCPGCGYKLEAVENAAPAVPAEPAKAAEPAEPTEQPAPAPELVANDAADCLTRCQKACNDARETAEQADKGTKQESFFDVCERDDKGHCKPRSGAKLPSDESGAAGGRYIAVKNANPDQARDDLGRWSTPDRARIREAIRRLFGPLADTRPKRRPKSAPPDVAPEEADEPPEQEETDMRSTNPDAAPASTAVAAVANAVAALFAARPAKPGKPVPKPTRRIATPKVAPKPKAAPPPASPKPRPATRPPAKGELAGLVLEVASH